jgi:hypothetical protein
MHPRAVGWAEEVGNNKFIEEYDIYHDESQVAGYWHGILFVPRSERMRLLALMAAVRKATEYHRPVSLKNVERSAGNLYRCVRGWLHLGVAALIQNLKGERYAIFTGEDGRSPGYDVLDRVIGARLIVLRIRDGLYSLHSYPDHASKVETTFRIGLKYGLKYFSGDGASLQVGSLHFDGYEHYGRRIDLVRIRERIGELPLGVSFPAEAIVDDRSSNHTRSECQSYDDCQLLQLTDVLVGGFRTALGHATREAQSDLCAPLGKLAGDWRRGPSRMRNSRWSRGYCIREGFIQNGRWHFADICPERLDTQHRLFTMGSS